MDSKNENGKKDVAAYQYGSATASIEDGARDGTVHDAVFGDLDGSGPDFRAVSGSGSTGVSSEDRC
jgi:hypothetical protein